MTPVSCVAGFNLTTDLISNTSYLQLHSHRLSPSVEPCLVLAGIFLTVPTFKSGS